MPFSFVDSANHYGEGLRWALFPLSQCFNYGIVRGVASQEEPPQALNGHDSPFFKELTGSGYRIRFGYQIALVINQLDLGTAFREGVRLGMKAAVQWIIIFRLALGAHLEAAHGGLRSVIGQGFNYGKAWPAVSAVCKGIAVAAVFNVQ